MTSDRIDELIALAALGELSEADRRELDEAAAADPIVAADLDEALAAAAALQRTHAEQPPAALRDSVSGRDRVDAAGFARRARCVAGGVARGGRERRRFRPAILAAAAAVALFVAGGVVLIATNDDTSDPIAAVIDAPDATSSRSRR